MKALLKVAIRTMAFLICSVLFIECQSPVRYDEKSISSDDSEVYSRYYIKKNKVFVGNSVIIGADLETFVYVGRNISKDKKNVYCWDQIIEQADPASFVLLPYRYCKDKKYVYFPYYAGANKIVPDADPNTFQALGLTFAKDANTVYCMYSVDSVGKMSGVDLHSLRALGGDTYCDTNYLYGVEGSILARRDTFDIEGW